MHTIFRGSCNRFTTATVFDGRPVGRRLRWLFGEQLFGHRLIPKRAQFTTWGGGVGQSNGDVVAGGRAPHMEDRGGCPSPVLVMGHNFDNEGCIAKPLIMVNWCFVFLCMHARLLRSHRRPSRGVR